MATAFTQEQLDALETALAEGVLSVEYGDKKVTYRSFNEMVKIRDMMRKALGLDDKSGGITYAKFSKGL